MLGDALISDEEDRRLLDASEGLTFINGKWVKSALNTPMTRRGEVPADRARGRHITDSI